MVVGWKKRERKSKYYRSFLNWFSNGVGFWLWNIKIKWSRRSQSKKSVQLNGQRALKLQHSSSERKARKQIWKRQQKVYIDPTTVVFNRQLIASSPTERMIIFVRSTLIRRLHANKFFSRWSWINHKSIQLPFNDAFRK